MKKMTFKEVGMPSIILLVICIIVAGALAVTNMLTADKIAQNALEAEIAARQAVLAGTEYELISEENDVTVYAVLVSEAPDVVSGTDTVGTDAAFRVWNGIQTVSETDVSSSDLSATDVSFTDAASASDVSSTDISASDISTGDKYIIGYVAVAKSKGYGGDVQIMIGVNLDLTIAGIEILSQSETAGLGANCENPEWLSQFVGKSGELAVSKDGGEIDAITASTITSRAVTKAVNKALAEVTKIEGRQAQ